jgi:hypothetical protein
MGLGGIDRKKGCNISKTALVAGLALEMIIFFRPPTQVAMAIFCSAVDLLRCL